jgi:hypothetical protein
MTQERHRGLTVFGDVEVVGHLAGAQRFRRQSHVARVVLDEEDLDGVTL